MRFSQGGIRDADIFGDTPIPLARLIAYSEEMISIKAAERIERIIDTHTGEPNELIKDLQIELLSAEKRKEMRQRKNRWLNGG